MTLFLRLLKFLSPFRWQVALAIFLGCATVASNIGLLGTAAYLIAGSAIVPFLILLTLPIYIVRFTGVFRAVSRYGERLDTHDVTFGLMAQLRTFVFCCLVPLSPSALLVVL